MRFEGCFTAIVTPFKGTGAKTPVDWKAYKELLLFQKKEGAAGIVAVGTTGESPTVSHQEHNTLIATAKEHFEGIVIASTGSNCTWEAVEMTRYAEDIGAEASLQVCPYYNKPSQEGLFRHFSEIASEVDLPIILYNIPGRSCREIAPQTIARLAEEHSNIVGVKEATGKEEAWKEIRKACGTKFLLLSGNDSDTLTMMKNYGAKGVISVASNAIPKRMQKFAEFGLRRKFKEMKKEDKALKEFFDVLFIDTNPIMVKEAMNMLDMNAGGFRLPLCETSEENRAKLHSVLRKTKLLK